ncbi:MAG: hypothetical protein HXY40_00445 [Chloroflexi bacterium]|nr:hypothetical protein [Chloroflexota bacterium]
MNLQVFPLETHWECDYFELEPDLYEFATTESAVSLATWRFDARRVENWAAWLHRTFTLSATEDCVRYHLLIDSAPPGTRIFVNEREVVTYAIGDDDAPFDMDITDSVALGENKLGLRVACDAGGYFSGVRLAVLPCA